MKKYIALIIVLCLLLSGCSLTTEGIKQAGNNTDNIQETTNTNIQDSQGGTNPQNQDTANNDTVQNTKNNENTNTPVAKDTNTDASVEALIQFEDDFLDTAFTGDIDDMLAFCNNTFADEMEKDPEKYIGTKPDYDIDEVDTAIKILEKGKYLLQSVVTAVKKSDKKKYEFTYSTTVEKIQGDYFVADFKRGIK